VLTKVYCFFFYDLHVDLLYCNYNCYWYYYFCVYSQRVSVVSWWLWNATWNFCWNF